MSFTLSYAATGTFTVYMNIKYYYGIYIGYTIKKASSSYSYGYTDPLEIGFDDDSTGTHRAFVEFDITSIPSGATITDVDLLYDCISNASSDQSNIKSCSRRPLNVASHPEYMDEMYAEFDTASSYVSASAFPVVGNNTIDLGETAVSDFQTAFDNEESWFAVAIGCGDESNRVMIDRDIVLAVTYNASSSVSIYPPDPASIDYTHNREIDVKNYLNGDRRAIDKGGLGRTCVINGVTQGLYGSNLIGSLRDIEKYHQSVSVTNLTSFINTDWKIRNFTSKRRGGMVFDWEINMERDD